MVFLQFDHRSISLLTECRMYILPTTGFEGKPFISETTLCCVYHSRHIGCCFPLGQYSKQYVSALVRLTYRLSGLLILITEIHFCLCSVYPLYIYMRESLCNVMRFSDAISELFLACLQHAFVFLRIAMRSKQNRAHF